MREELEGFHPPKTVTRSRLIKRIQVAIFICILTMSAWLVFAPTDHKLKTRNLFRATPDN